MDWATDRDTTISKPSKYGPRTCTEVAWNKQILGQLAAGFDRLRSEDCTCVYDVESALLTTSDPSSSSSSSNASGGNANNMQQLTATHKFSFGDACVSLNWIPTNPNLLAVGTSTGWIRVYDLRNGHVATMSVMAHTNIRSKKVKGIRSDPFNFNLISSFSDSPGEAVKVWDLRKVEKSKEAPVFTVHPHSTPVNSSSSASGNGVTGSYVTDIEYSPVRANVLAVGTSKSDDVQLFNTKSSSMDVQSRIPILSINVPGGVKYMSWNRGAESNVVTSEHHNQKSNDDSGMFNFSNVESKGPDENVTNVADHHRLLVLTRKMEYVDMAVVERQPLAVNAQNEIIFGRDTTLTMVKPAQAVPRTHVDFHNGNVKDCTASQDSSVPIRSLKSSYFGIDDSLIRQRCAAGYAIDSGKNLQSLSDELDELDPTSPEASACIELLRAWSWVDRVETLHIKDKSFNLQNSGILRLLNDDNLSSSDSTGTSNTGSDGVGSHRDKGLLHPVLGRPVFLSHRRSVGRLLCGWAALHGLRGAKVSQQPSSPAKQDGPFVEHSESAKLHEIVHDCEMVEHFERGAALALWHGDLAMAVKVLQRTIVNNTKGNKTLAGVKIDSDDDDASTWKSEDDDDDQISQQDEDDDDDEDATFMSDAGGDDSCSASSSNSAVSSATNDTYLASDYVELLSLVAMCIAGYSGVMASQGAAANSVATLSPQKRSSGKKSEGKSKSSTAVNPKVTMWASMCQMVLSKLKETEISTGRRGASYLYAACLFLLETQQRSENYSVLNDERIAFEDRVAFACTYLSYQQMCTFLLALENQCLKEGNIEGLVITGLKTRDGMKLLQRYVDLRNDIQTAALLVARISSTLEISSSTDDLKESSGQSMSDSAGSISNDSDLVSGVLEKQFLQEYRMLLNRWELYMTRASLDVELGCRYRAHQALVSKQTGAAGTGSGNDNNSRSMGPGGRPAVTRGGGSSGGSSAGGGGDKGSGSVYRIPPHNDSPHVLLRCYYCR